jgi:serine O-acetyltransferase
MIHYRLAHRLYALGLPLLARIISELAHAATGIDIHPGAKIGAGFFIDHGTGVVIGETAVIGQRVRLYQAVTLGAKRFPTNADGSLQKGLPRHPILEDDVVIYAGATVLGRITIGKGAVIGGNVWLTHDVAPGARVAQAASREEVFETLGGPATRRDAGLLRALDRIALGLQRGQVALRSQDLAHLQHGDRGRVVGQRFLGRLQPGREPPFAQVLEGRVFLAAGLFRMASLQASSRSA